MLVPGKYEIVVFFTRPQVSPYLEWLETLDAKTQDRVLVRVRRLEQGQFGDFRKIDRNLYELRLFFGPGYRVYFGEVHGRRILLLLGGDKSSQSADIRKAKEFWKIYTEDSI